MTGPVQLDFENRDLERSLAMILAKSRNTRRNAERLVAAGGEVVDSITSGIDEATRRVERMTQRPPEPSAPPERDPILKPEPEA